MARKATRRKVRYDGIDAVDLFCGGGGLLVAYGRRALMFAWELISMAAVNMHTNNGAAFAASARTGKMV